MNLLRHLKSPLWSKVKNIINILRLNCKLELLILFWGIAGTIFLQKMQVDVTFILNYLTEARCSSVASVASVIIGIYVTIWSIFATSATKLNIEFLTNKLEDQLFFVIGIGILEAFILLIMCVFVPSTFHYYTIFLAVFIMLTIVSFAKCVIMIMSSTKLNIKYIVEEYDEQQKERIEMLTKIDEIYHRVTEKK